MIGSRAVPARDGADGRRAPAVVALVVVALAMTAVLVAGCGSQTASSTGAGTASPSAKPSPNTRAQFRAYLVKLDKYDPKGALSDTNVKQVNAQLDALDWYDAGAVETVAERLKDIARGFGQARDHFAAMRPPASAIRSHQALLTALDELQQGLDHLASCMESRNHAEYDMSRTECRYALQDAKRWQRLLKAEAKVLKVKIPSGLHLQAE
jgi:hypothetical protein